MIEVIVGEHAANRFNHDTLLGVALMKALREAGVPVLGDSFVLRGVPEGSTLSYHCEEDLDGRMHHFTWSEDADDRKTGAPLRVKLDIGYARKYGRHAVVAPEPQDDEL